MSQIRSHRIKKNIIHNFYLRKFLEICNNHRSLSLFRSMLVLFVVGLCLNWNFCWWSNEICHNIWLTLHIPGQNSFLLDCFYRCFVKVLQLILLTILFLLLLSTTFSRIRNARYCSNWSSCHILNHSSEISRLHTKKPIG